MYTYRDVVRGCIVVSKREFCEGVLGIHQSVPNSKLGLGLGLGLDNILGSHWRWSCQSLTVCVF